MSTETAAKPVTMDELVALCLRRGFIFQASEIYGGLNGFWDYGPLGIELKNNIRDAWWHQMVKCPPVGPEGEALTILGLDSSIIQHPKVWEASGHIGGFNDPMVDCRETKSRYRFDHIQAYRHKSDETLPLFAFVQGEPEPAEKKIKKAKKGDPATDFEVVALTDLETTDFSRVIGPDAKALGTLTEPRQFNLMFKTYVGAVQDEDSVAYLRPETAQGIFLNYRRIVDTMRVKAPFGIAQIGKAFRNEVTPRNFIFRSREFEQMEMEWFCHPDEARKWYEFWCKARTDWWKSIGLSAKNLQLREHEVDELAHYAKEGCGTYDIEYRFPFTAPGYGELEGVAHRGDFDLTQHQKHSKAKLGFFDEERKERFIPHVIEPAAGLSRGVLAIMCEAFVHDPARPSKMFMKFHPRVAPIKAAVFPLVNKDGMPEVAAKLYEELGQSYAVQLDNKQAIGKRYARMDEAGTPYCFTIDGDTLKDQTVTVRARDTLAQERIALDKVKSYLADKIGF
jgi:glycyl-tRNA synthetase